MFTWYRCQILEDFEFLKVNSTLTTLNLRGNLIDVEGAVVIAEALKLNVSLISLDLCSNRIEAGALAIAEALKVNSALTSLQICENNITVVGGDCNRCSFESEFNAKITSNVV